MRRPNPPYDKWLKVLGSPVKKIRFRKSGNVDVVIVPRRRNESYRKVKKQARKAQRAGLLDPGPMFQKFRKAAGISKKGRKKNPISAEKEKFYHKALAIDERFQKALEKKYGSRAGDMRYRTKELPAYLRRLGTAMQKATERYRAVNPSDAYEAGRRALRTGAAKHGTVNLTPSIAQRKEWGHAWKEFMRGWNAEKKAR